MNWELIISCLALGVSVFTYFKHDKKIKAQEQIINDYQINKIAKENEEIKKASIRGNIIKGDRGKRTLKVYNCGKATARDIRVEGLDMGSFVVMRNDLFPYELMNPQDYTEVFIWVVKGSPSTIKLKYIWNDDFGQNNEFEQVLTL
jgi:hypothetical protein